MTLESTSSDSRVRDALSGRPKVAIVKGASSGIGLEMVQCVARRFLPLKNDHLETQLATFVGAGKTRQSCATTTTLR